MEDFLNVYCKLPCRNQHHPVTLGPDVSLNIYMHVCMYVSRCECIKNVCQECVCGQQLQAARRAAARPG